MDTPDAIFLEKKQVSPIKDSLISLNTIAMSEEFTFQYDSGIFRLQNIKH